MAIRAAGSLATLLALGLGSPADGGECRLALVLALDVSGSIDAHEDRLQRDGLAHALVAPEVARAFLAGDPVALYAFQWAGADSHVRLLPGWQMVRSEADLVRIAATLAATEKTPSGQEGRPPMATAVGAALGHAAVALSEAPACQAETVDVAGDGASNHGVAPQVVYGSGLLNEVTVNALVVPSPGRRQSLVAWFEAEVLHGPGAFLVVADGYGDYERAMREKLRRELGAPLVSGWPVAGEAG